MMASNPYESPALDAAAPIETAARRMLKRAVRSLLNLLIVIAYTGAVIAAIWLFYSGYPWTVGLGAVALFMFGALFAGGNWRERIVLCVSVPFFALGGYLGWRSFFAMASFSWFRNAFNGPGVLLGLILFVSLFAMAVGFGAALALYRLAKSCVPTAASGTTNQDRGVDNPQSLN